MLFLHGIQYFKSGLYDTNNSNVVLAPGAFTGAYINKEIFAHETMDIPNVGIQDKVNDKRDEMLGLLQDMGITNHNFKHFSTASQYELIVSPKKLEKAIEKIKNAPSKFATDVAEYKDLYERKCGTWEKERIQERINSVSRTEYKSKTYEPEVQLKTKYVFNGFHNASAYIGLTKDSEEHKEIHSLFLNQIFPLFKTRQSLEYRNIIESGNLYNCAIYLEEFLFIELEKNNEQKIIDKEDELEHKFDVYVKYKVDKYYSDLMFKQGSLAYAEDNPTHVKNKALNQRDELVTQPLNEFKDELDEQVKRKVSSIVAKIEEGLKAIAVKHGKLIDAENGKKIIQEQTQEKEIFNSSKNDDYDMVEWENKTIEQRRAYQAENVKKYYNQYINENTPNAEFYTPKEIKEDAIHREGLIKTVKKEHEEILTKIIEDVQITKEKLKEYDILKSSNKKLLDSYIGGFTDVYNKDLKVVNHISKELMGNILTRLGHIGKDMFLAAHEISSTPSDPTDIRTDSIEFMAKRVGSVMWEKYVYELNSHINSIYEKNSVDGKIVRKDNIVDSFEFVENPVLRNAIESRIPTFDLVNLSNGMKEIERDEDGKFKLSKGYHKILNIDTESLITVIYEWTGKHPSLNIFIPDSFFMEMVSIEGTKDRYKIMLEELNAEIDQLNETAPSASIFDNDENNVEKILLPHVTFIKKDDANDKTLKSFEKEYMVHESFDRRLLKNAYEKQSEKMIRETVFGDDQYYKKGLDRVKEYFHAVMVVHNIRLKEETGFFVNPFQVDENNKPLELKGTVAFMSSSADKHIKFNKEYRDTTMGIILGDESLISPSYQPNIANVLGLNYGVEQNAELERRIEKEKDNIFFDAVPNGQVVWDKKSNEWLETFRSNQENILKPGDSNWLFKELIKAESPVKRLLAESYGKPLVKEENSSTVPEKKGLFGSLFSKKKEEIIIPSSADSNIKWRVDYESFEKVAEVHYGAYKQSNNYPGHGVSEEIMNEESINKNKELSNDWEKEKVKIDQGNWFYEEIEEEVEKIKEVEEIKEVKPEKEELYIRFGNYKN